MADTMEHAFAKVCEVFGIESLNKHQEDAIKYVVEEKKDVFVNLPTGFGKSLIYQALPLVYSCLQSTVEKNIIVMISPLTSLMKDQVMRLISLGITAISAKVFGDMVGTDLTVVSEDFSSVEEDDLLPEDWNSILVDKELAELAIEELSQIDMNDSEDDSTDNVLRDVPATALNALMNLSFDAVL
ncbi:Bloom syndrome protein-like [Acropora millepora]|uniref:Bloom syndrome protein-like n=1 Tax=Acropora millepora TaxID=45264 RepID=UPI001CF23D25|nr:Bloom syndrome protein-like [Acropora millepora]